MHNLENGNEWLLDRNKFINRKYLMQEMYQNFMEGDKDWDVPKVSQFYHTVLHLCLNSLKAWRSLLFSCYTAHICLMRLVCF
jgi:hypothetical protein